MKNLETLTQPIAAEVQKDIFETTQANLTSQGSLLEGVRPLDEVDRSILEMQLGANAAEKVVGMSPGLYEVDLSETLFTGGVCALSTRESKLLRMDAAMEDGVTGLRLPFRETDDLERLQDVVSAVQVFETVGLTPYRTAIVLEDELWSERVAWLLRDAGEDEAAVAAAGLVESRNRKAMASVDALRQYLFGGKLESIQAVEPVLDSAVLEPLTEGTDRMLKEIGLEDISTPYRRVFAGMYSYVWRDVLQQAGVVAEDQVMAIYEPSKHIGREDGMFQDISRFKAAAVRQIPFMQPGSPAEKLGVIAYMEPRDPNGKRFRDAVPLALMPNSLNYRNFDFSRFPIVPKKKDDQMAAYTEFGFYDDLGSTSLLKNPAFLWGIMYPASNTTAWLLREMQGISGNYKDRTRVELGSVQDGAERRQAADRLRSGYSVSMRKSAEDLIWELQNMNEVMFGGQDEAQ